MDGNLYSEFRKHLPQVHWQRIETAMMGSGVPDVNGCYDGFEFWIENKYTHACKLASNLTDMQIGWALARSFHGGMVWLAVRKFHDGGPRLGPAVDILWLIKPRYLSHIQKLGVPPDPLPFLAERGMYSFEGGPSNWPWPTVLNLLLGITYDVSLRL